MGSKSTGPLFSSNRYATKIGKFLLVSYNTAQIIVEVTTIVLVVCNYSFQWKGEVCKCTKVKEILVKFMFIEDADNEHDCGIMMAHYFFFLSIVNHCAFFGIAWIYAKVIKSEYVPCQYKKISYFDKPTSIIFPILSWLAIRYKYHFKHLIATESIVTVISPITYLYDMVNPGTYTTGYIFALISVQ